MSRCIKCEYFKQSFIKVLTKKLTVVFLLLKCPRSFGRQNRQAMHREALSRSLLYSHNLIGKPTVTLTCRSITLHNGGAGGTPQGIKVINTSSPRRYHRSWDKQSQSVTKTVLSEATTEKGLEASLPLEDAKVSIQQPAKIFNLKAKDILSTPDEPFAPAEPFKREDSSSVANHMLLETKIFSSQSVEGLLKLSTEPDLTLKHGCLIISRLGSLAQARNDSRFSQRIVADKRFVRVFNLIQRGNHSQFPHTLLLALSVSESKTNPRNGKLLRIKFLNLYLSGYSKIGHGNIVGSFSVARKGAELVHASMSFEIPGKVCTNPA